MSQDGDNGNGRDLRGELENDDGIYPESIILEPGQIITGTIVRYTSGTTAFGECQIAVLESEENDSLGSLWLYHTVLKNEFARLHPQPGERVGIKYFGKTSKGYHLWKLIVDRPEKLPDFSSSATEEGPPGDFLFASDEPIPELPDDEFNPF
jgi:hypothetical protein